MARTSNFSDEDILDIARAALIDGVNHVVLGRKYNCSAAHIGRLIEQARAKQLVEVFIFKPGKRQREEDLRARYKGLTSRIVGSFDDADRQMKILGVAGAELFDHLVDEQAARGDVHVVVSGGLTLFNVVSHLEERERKNVYFWPTALIGRGNDIRTHIDPLVNCSVAWIRSGAIPDTFPHSVSVFPYLDGVRERARDTADAAERVRITQDAVAVVEADDHVNKFLEGFPVPDIAFLSTGVIEALDFNESKGDKRWESLTMTRLFDDIVTAVELSARGASAEIAYRFFDRFGKDLDLDMLAGSRRIFRQIGKMREGNRPVVLVSGRQEKAVAIRTALNTGLFTHLITDDDTARKVLS